MIHVHGIRNKFISHHIAVDCERCSINKISNLIVFSVCMFDIDDVIISENERLILYEGIHVHTSNDTGNSMGYSLCCNIFMMMIFFFIVFSL